MITNKSFTIRIGHTRFWPIKFASSSWFDYHFSARMKTFVEDLFSDKFFQARGISLSHVITNYRSTSLSTEVFIHDAKLYDFYNTLPSARALKFGQLKKKSKKYLKLRSRLKGRVKSSKLNSKLFNLNRKKFVFFASKFRCSEVFYRLRLNKTRKSNLRRKFRAAVIKTKVKSFTRRRGFRLRSRNSIFFKRRFRSLKFITKAVRRISSRFIRRIGVRRPRFLFIKRSSSYSVSQNASIFYRYLAFRSFARQVRAERSGKKRRITSRSRKAFRNSSSRRADKKPTPRTRYMERLSNFAKYAPNFTNPGSSLAGLLPKLTRINKERAQGKLISSRRRSLKKKLSKKHGFNKFLGDKRRRFRGSPLQPNHQRSAKFIFFNQYSAYASSRFIRYRFYHFIAKFISSQIYMSIRIPIIVRFSFFPIHRGTSSFYLNFITTKLYYRYILSDVVKPIVRISLRYYRGFVIHCKGRFTRAQIAVTKRFVRRSVSYSKVKSSLDYAQKSVVLKYGTCNLRVWIRH